MMTFHIPTTITLHETLSRKAGLVSATAAAFIEYFFCRGDYFMAVNKDILVAVVAELLSVMHRVGYDLQA